MTKLQIDMMEEVSCGLPVVESESIPPDEIRIINWREVPIVQTKPMEIVGMSNKIVGDKVQVTVSFTPPVYEILK
jgi:hypothetical protein